MAQLTFMDKLDEEQLLNAEKVAIKAKALGIDPKFAVAIAYHESGLRTDAPNGADGEVGMMQVKPDTAQLVRPK
jgi:soluble lytic murein transglycosylase-like protein